MEKALVIPIADVKGEKSLKQLTQLLDSVREYPTPIICCFDACQEDFIEFFMDEYPMITPLINNRNRLNFARNANLGLRTAHREFKASAILVNQDCILPGWHIMQHFEGNGIATTRSQNEATNIDAVNNLNAMNLIDRVQCERFPFYCTFINSKVMDKVGYLDGVFIATFEDDDFCTRTHLAGFPVESLAISIFHEGSHIDTTGDWESASGSYNAVRLGENLSKYGTKYQVPEGVPHEEMLKWILENHAWRDELYVG